MGTNCYRPGKERGPWYEILWLRRHMDARAAKGEDVTWYREIYKSWLTYPEYKAGDDYNRRQGFYGGLANVADKREPVTKQIHKENHVTPPDFENIDIVTEKIMFWADQGKSTRKIAELLKVEGFDISHMTVARRLQGVML